MGGPGGAHDCSMLMLALPQTYICAVNAARRMELRRSCDAAQVRRKRLLGGESVDDLPDEYSDLFQPAADGGGRQKRGAAAIIAAASAVCATLNLFQIVRLT
eukprot:366528-Chlamydomonas_euryale.AAC.7